MRSSKKKKAFNDFLFKNILLVSLVILVQMGTNCIAADSWTGTWDTRWKGGGARMTLIQSGNQVTGSYDYRNGKINGTISGNTLSGYYSQDNGSGTIVFTLAHDGKSFTGNYNAKNTNDSSWWNGTKIGVTTVGSPLWTGIWNTQWEGGGSRMTLFQSGNQVTGSYDYRNGKINGTISGNTLRGHYKQDNGSGTIVFTIANDGKSFTGNYNAKNTNDSSWWNGTKIGVTTVESTLWTGTWDTQWKGGGSRMTLFQSGNQVTGSYEYMNGKINGTISGNTLRGHYKQDNGSGTIVFTIANDGKSFAGKYDSKTSADSGWWNGTKKH